MKKLINILGNGIDRLVWAVGCFAISRYAWENWPLAYALTVGVLIVGLGIWYMRRFFVELFRAGLKGE